MLIKNLEWRLNMKNCNAKIAEAAYYIWEAQGCPSGMDEIHWAMAVEQLSKSCKKSSSCAMKKASAKKVAAKKPAAKKAVAKKIAAPKVAVAKAISIKK